MAGNAELISVGVPKVRAIVVGMVLGAQPGLPFGGAATAESHLIRPTDRLSVLRGKRDHLAITGRVVVTVVWPADDKVRSCHAFTVPASPRPRWVTPTHFDTEGVHEGLVEAARPVEVGHAYKDMREHVGGDRGVAA